ncbi:hypothetical protein E7681_06365 [Thalassobius vesicularis]|uniref:Uncharacterized protein n=1 Tax=Thalassobius vesicularis TaxID=1294297 RepID=A0A4S3MBN1_9RHOB|nr:hypothetical protein E7681_06365 [Thalassobius vesicularis]
MKKSAILILFLSASAAFAGTKPNFLSVNYNADGFSGKAGSDWTDADLKSNAFGALCPNGQKVKDLKITRDDKGVAKFTGRCKK